MQTVGHMLYVLYMLYIEPIIIIAINGVHNLEPYIHDFNIGDSGGDRGRRVSASVCANVPHNTADSFIELSYREK